MIRDRKTHSILSAIQTGSQLGMKTLDTSLFELYTKRLIEKEEMLRLAERPDELLEKLGEHVPDYMRTDDGSQPRRPGGYGQQPGGQGPTPPGYGQQQSRR
jgi:twitching motility protein PilT